MSYRKHLMTSAEPPSELYKAVELGTNLAEVGTNCISRQAAIDALRAMQTYKLFAGDDMLLIDQAGAQTELMMLPPAQPQRIKGHWIEHDDGLTACECSVCHEKYALYEEDVFGRNFCPNCGAEMEREVAE